MADLEIRRGRNLATITFLTIQGRRWLRNNFEGDVYVINNDYIEDFVENVVRDGLEIEVL